MALRGSSVIIQRIISMMAGSAASGSHTYATWDPANKGADITLSNGNLTATETVSAAEFVRSTLSKSTGKWYWEITITTAPGVGNYYVGIVNSSAVPGTEGVGYTTNGWGYRGNGQKVNGTGFVYGATYTTGDVIGIALDMDVGTLIFYKNNVSQGTAFTGLSGTMFAGVTPSQGSGITGVMTANFGATALTYSPPVGYNAGLYN